MNEQKIIPERINLTRLIVDKNDEPHDKEPGPDVPFGTAIEVLTTQRHYADLLGHVLIRVMTDAAPEGDMFKHFGLPTEGDSVLDVVLTINGVQAPIRPFVRLYEEQYDRIVAEAARGLLAEKCADISNALYGLEQEIKSKGEELFGTRD